jgi:UPF0271 protein
MKLNADLGEGLLWKSKNVAYFLAPHIHMANISCNLHAGDENHIRETIEICLDNNVQIGAHPSYDDRKNFGRISHEISDSEARELILRQWDWLNKLVREAGGVISHLKTHGALYNDLSKNSRLASVVQETISSIDKDLIHVCSPHVKGQNLMPEGFIDRLYKPNGHLTSRSEKGAVYNNIKDIINQVNDLKVGYVHTSDGSKLSLNAETVCLHGDNPVIIKYIDLIMEALHED